MKKMLFIILWINLLSIFIISCGIQIGDPCSSNIDCGQNRICDKSQPGGYCTVSPCEEETCPSEAVCIFFSTWDSFCMLKCSQSEDCRKDYVCVDDDIYGEQPFCNQAP